MLSHPLLWQLHPDGFASSSQRSQNRNILIIHAHVILLLYPEALLGHRKGKRLGTFMHLRKTVQRL